MKACALLAAAVIIVAGISFTAFGQNINQVEFVFTAATNTPLYRASDLFSGGPEATPTPDGGFATWLFTPQAASGSVSNAAASPTFLVTNIFLRGTPSVVLPGIYQSSPYSGLIIVPDRDLIDSRMVHAPTSTSQFAILFVNPPLHLEPKR